jgi:hypothetical protein
MSDAIIKTKYRPVFLVKPGTISPRDIKRTEKQAGICIVECSDPESARFLDAPLDQDIDAQAAAALRLMRFVVSHNETSFTKGTLMKWFLEVLMTQPAPAPVKRVGAK